MFEKKSTMGFDSATPGFVTAVTPQLICIIQSTTDSADDSARQGQNLEMEKNSDN